MPQYEQAQPEGSNDPPTVRLDQIPEEQRLAAQLQSHGQPVALAQGEQPKPPEVLPLLERQSSRRGVFRSIRQARKARDETLAVEVKPTNFKDRWRMSRRRMTAASLVGGVGLWLSEETAIWAVTHWDALTKTIGHVVHQGDEARKVFKFKDAFEKRMKALPSNEKLKAAVPNLGRKINLDDFQRERKTKGPINVRLVSVGTSNSFALGTDDLNHPTEQKHAAVYRAAEGLKEAARTVLGIGKILTLVLARPGAYSGYQFPREYTLITWIS